MKVAAGRIAWPSSVAGKTVSSAWAEKANSAAAAVAATSVGRISHLLSKAWTGSTCRAVDGVRLTAG